MKQFNKISKLLEQDLEQARLIFAINDITDRLQTMIEQLAKMSVNDVMPIVDDMRGVFGPDKSSKFETASNDALDNAVEAVKKAKEAIANESLRLEGKDVPDNDMAHDDLSDESESNEESDEEKSSKDDEESDDDFDMDDLFGGSEGASGEKSEPLGRKKRTESVQTNKKIIKEGWSTLLPHQTNNFESRVKEIVEGFFINHPYNISSDSDVILVRNINGQLLFAIDPYVNANSVGFSEPPYECVAYVNIEFSRPENASLASKLKDILSRKITAWATDDYDVCSIEIEAKLNENIINESFNVVDIVSKFIDSGRMSKTEFKRINRLGINESDLGIKPKTKKLVESSKIKLRKKIAEVSKKISKLK
jgi:hypothetical protein